MTKPGFIKLAARVVKRERKKSGLNQTEFARLVGASQAAVSKVENAQQAPGLFEWLRFCRAFKINPTLEGEK